MEHGIILNSYQNYKIIITPRFEAIFANSNFCCNTILIKSWHFDLIKIWIVVKFLFIVIVGVSEFSNQNFKTHVITCENLKINLWISRDHDEIIRSGSSKGSALFSSIRHLGKIRPYELIFFSFLKIFNNNSNIIWPSGRQHVISQIL